MSKNTETRYMLFNRNTYARTGQMKSVKNAATREDAREAKRSSTQNLGIYDRHNGSIIH